MTSNDPEPLMNITQKAPWLMDGDKSYYEERVQEEDARQVLGSISNHHNLTIISEGNRIFQQPLRLKLMDDKVLIDKPFEWDDSISSFHVFFRREDDDSQHFFQVAGAKSGQGTISARKPERIYLLQKRRFGRTLAPVGSKIIFRDDSNRVNSAFVHDISKGGMLVWTSDSEAHHMVNSILHDVFISVPIKEELEGKKSPARNNRVLPYSTKGKIVRRHTDQSTLRYGVSFIHENDLLARRFNSLIGQLQNNYSARNIHGKA
ncbi:MAG: PilZ domain-containing protein [Thermodesulfobacteriota bacterium]